MGRGGGNRIPKISQSELSIDQLQRVGVNIYLLPFPFSLWVKILLFVIKTTIIIKISNKWLEPNQDWSTLKKN